jgi:hypothetical protein
MLTMNPDLFTIEQSKQMGTWPPSNLVSHGISPYVSRQKKDDLIIFDVGVMKGENAFMLLSKDEKKKIKTIYGIPSCAKDKETEFAEYEKLALENLKGESRFELKKIISAHKKADIICIHSQSDLEKNLFDYYDRVESGGIFCGNEHGSSHVKEALSKFRREKKIGTPISVANDCWFWYVR